MTARIVIADDDEDIRRLVAFMLRKRGYTVSEASAGDVALTLMRDELPDLAVLDVMMPGLTGLDVAREATADPRTAHIPIIMLSAKGQAVDIDIGLHAGARRYLTKPFAPQQLADEVAAVLAEPPVAAVPDTQISSESATPNAVHAIESDLDEGLSALVVDDDPDINRLVRARLAARGYATSTASNGEEALALIAEQPPDLLLLDVSMPGVGGLEVLESVRSRALDTAVIMMTAFGSEEVAIDAMRRGTDDYLRKPFEPREFQSVVERTVSRLILTRQNALLRRQLDEKRRQLEAEIAAASEIQLGLLPREHPALPGFDIAVRFIPAREVGGDFYDWQMAESGELLLTVGDVMGKGMPAALLMATARAVFRAVGEQNEPGEAVERAAAALERDLDRSGSFVTLFHARLNPATRQLRYVDAGHGHAVLRRANGRAESLEPRGLPVGMLPDAAYEEGSVTLEPGDVLTLYSDGVIDANPDLDLDRAAVARIAGHGDAESICDRLIETVAPGEHLPDDLTLLVLTCTGEE